MPQHPFDVVGVGINSVDSVAVLPAFPAGAGPLSKMRIARYQLYSGGQTATAMAACARLGLRASYVGAVGNDANGATVREALSAAGVDTSSVVVHEATTRFAIILVDQSSGERAVLWDFDARLSLSNDELPIETLRSARLVHVDDVDEGAAVAAARTAHAKGIPVTSDIDHVSGATRELLDAVTVAIFAEHVPLELCGGVAGQRAEPPSDAEIREALLALPRRSEQTLCVTLGARGALALDNDGLHHHHGYSIRAVDTTGAGDVFRAGFIYAMLEGWPIDARLRWANAAAAVSCTRPGATASVPTFEEVERMVRTGRE